MGCSAKVPTGPDWKSWCRAQNLQISVSLDVGDDGKITWAKPETC